MAVRATQDLQRAIIKTYTVKAATTAVAGRVAKFGATDTEVEVAAAGDEEKALCVFMEAAAASERVQCVLIDGGGAIMPCIVGTGGATRGLAAKLAADGLTNCGAGEPGIGEFAQSGVIGDLVGVILGSRVGV